MNIATAFGIVEEDVEAVLRANALRVANTQGQSFAAMAQRLIDDLDHNAIAAAALNGGCEIDEQIDAAYEAIHAQLTEQGVICRSSPTSRRDSVLLNCHQSNSTLPSLRTDHYRANNALQHISS